MLHIELLWGMGNACVQGWSVLLLLSPHTQGCPQHIFWPVIPDTEPVSSFGMDSSSTAFPVPDSNSSGSSPPTLLAQSALSLLGLSWSVA